MSKVIKILTWTPLSLVDKRVAQFAQGAQMVAAGIVTGQPTLVMAGISWGAQAFAKPPTPSSQSDRLTTSINPRESFKRVFNRTAMATDLRYEEWFGTDQERCRQIIATASHKIESVDEIWIDDQLAWSSGGGVTSKFSGYFWVRHVILEGGAANGVTFGSGKWNDARRLRGCAFVDLEFKVTGNSKKAESPFSGGVPTRLTIIGKGGMVYDPRRDSTVPGGSGAMRANDQSTWAFAVGGDVIGGNVALQILAELLGWKINGMLALGSGLPRKRIDLESFIDAANLCDELVGRSAGGTEPRYRGAGVLSEGDDPQTRLNTMLAACNGRLRDSSGRLALAIMHNDLASAAADPGLTTDDVMGPFTWNPDPAVDQCPNVARGRYTDASANSLYQQVDLPEIVVDTDDGIERVLQHDLVWVESASQGQRILKQNLQRKQYALSFQAPFDVRACRYGVGDVVPFTFDPLNFDRRLFRVQDLDLNTNPATAVLTEESTAIYAWDADDRAPVVAATPIYYDTLNNPLIQAIADAVEKSTIIRGAYVKISGELLTASEFGGTASITIADHIWDYPNTADDVARTGSTITSLDLGTRYYVYFDDDTLEDATPSYQVSLTIGDALNSSANPYRHFLDFVDTPVSGGPPAGGGGGGGGYCPCGSMFLRERTRGIVPAATIAVDDQVWGKHEVTGVWGWYRVAAAEPQTAAAFRYPLAGAMFETSGDHLNWAGGGWRKSASLPGAVSIGSHTVYAIEIEDAHTYELLPSADAVRGTLSHNKTVDPDL